MAQKKFQTAVTSLFIIGSRRSLYRIDRNDERYYPEMSNLEISDQNLARPGRFWFPHVLRKVQTAVTWLVMAEAQTYLHCAAGATKSDRYVILASLAYLAR